VGKVKKPWEREEMRDVMNSDTGKTPTPDQKKGRKRTKSCITERERPNHRVKQKGAKGKGKAIGSVRWGHLPRSRKKGGLAKVRAAKKYAVAIRQKVECVDVKGKT